MNPAELNHVFSALIQEGRSEQVYQDFLEANSELIPREFVQNHGIHFSLVLRKLGLARDYTTDFFYLAKSSATWHCVLVEIEKPQSPYFREGTADLHADFRVALDQVARWRAWFADEHNFEGFVNGTIRPLRIPITMTANPCYIKYVLVTGRRSEYEQNEQRRRLISAHEREDFHILSYDSLLEDLHSKMPLYVAARHNEGVDILSDRFAGESLFSWMPPERLRISNALREDIVRHRAEWFHKRAIDRFTLDEVLPRVPVLA